MMNSFLIIISIFAIFAFGIVVAFLGNSKKMILRVPLLSSIFASIMSLILGIKLYENGAYLSFNSNIIVDSLGFLHIILINFIFTCTAFYSLDYFHNHNNDHKSLIYLRRYAALWQGFQAMLLLVVLSNNIGLTWIALEATTIVSSFLILSYHDSLSVEAMWKYILICSVGIALAFLGTVLVIAAAHSLPEHNSVYTFTELQKYAPKLDSSLMLFAFIFIIVGFGTKAGLAPMHTWLPDAHSQAPTPVSAVFSGVMLNCALFVIMRYMPIMNSLKMSGYQVQSILFFFGITSLLIGVIFIPIQHDLKRLLAYCSIEHIGIIVIGLGLGGFGTVVALLHTINHSFSKMLAFFSAGSLINHYKTRTMDKICGTFKVMPIWSFAFLMSMLALLGVAPLSVFTSELFLAKAAFISKHYIILAVFMFGVLAIFIPMFKFLLNIVYGKPGADIKRDNQVSIWNIGIMLICIGEFIIFGLWLPQPLMSFLNKAAAIIEHGNNFIK